MHGTRFRQPAQRIGEPRDIFRDEIEAKRLDGDQPIPLRFIGAKDWAEDAAADLVEDPERPEGGWGNETGGLVERQRGDSFGTSRIVARSPWRAPTRGADEEPVVDWLGAQSLGDAPGERRGARGGRSEPSAVDSPARQDVRRGFRERRPALCGQSRRSAGMARDHRARPARAARSRGARPAGRRPARGARGSGGSEALGRRTCRSRRGLLSITGQQAGLFGGPLYTLLKAVTALQLARRVRQEHGVPAVAVFWVDSEDHDWKEVRGASVLVADYAVADVILADLPHAGTYPVASLVLDEGVDAAIDTIDTALARSEFTTEVLAALRRHYRPGNRMSTAFAGWLDELLGRTGARRVRCGRSRGPSRSSPRSSSRELEQPGRAAQLAREAGEADGAARPRAASRVRPRMPSRSSISTSTAGDRFAGATRNS